MKLIQKFREQFQEPFEEYQEKARQFWLTLAPREKIIISVLTGILGVLIVVFVVKESTSLLISASSTAERNMENAERIQRLAAELSDQRMELQRYTQLDQKRGGENFSLTGFLNAQAAEAGVTVAKVSSTRPRVTAGKTESADEAEEWVEVQFGKGAALEPTMRFLSEAEEALGVRLVELTIKPDFAEPNKLDVTAVFAGKKTL